MMAYSHIIIGITSYIALAEPVAVAPLVAVALGSLLPDADHEQATINKLLPPLKLVAKFTKHRALTHSMAFVLLVVAVAFLIGDYLALCVAWGYVMHVLADMLTVSGVKFFHPLSGMNVRVAWLRTNGATEHLIISMCGLYLVWSIVVWAGYQDVVLNLAREVLGRLS